MLTSKQKDIPSCTHPTHRIRAALPMILFLITSTFQKCQVLEERCKIGPARMAQPRDSCPRNQEESGNDSNYKGTSVFKEIHLCDQNDSWNLIVHVTAKVMPNN